MYFLRKEPRRGTLVRDLVARSLAGTLSVEISGIVLMELLVEPLTTGSAERLTAVRLFTEQQPGIRISDVSREVLFIAAEVRAVTQLKAPDALVVASASLGGCEAIVGNDRRFRRINGLDPLRSALISRTLRTPRYIHLDDYVAGA